MLYLRFYSCLEKQLASLRKTTNGKLCHEEWRKIPTAVLHPNLRKSLYVEDPSDCLAFSPGRILRRMAGEQVHMMLSWRTRWTYPKVIFKNSALWICSLGYIFTCVFLFYRCWFCFGIQRIQLSLTYILQMALNYLKPQNPGMNSFLTSSAEKVCLLLLLAFPVNSRINATGVRIKRASFL